MRLIATAILTALWVATQCAGQSSSHHHPHHRVTVRKSHHRRNQPIDIFQLATSPETSSDGERSPRWRTKADVAAEERALKKRRKNAGGSGGGGKAAWRKNKPKRKEASSSASAASVASSLQNLLPVPPAHLPDAVVAGGGFECCPTTTDVVQPRGGVNMEGHLVKLFRPNDMEQRIYEHSCRPEVIDQPCRFVDELVRPMSRCVQQYTYTYALVENRDHTGTGLEWRMDYIRTRSGCACSIQPP